MPHLVATLIYLSQNYSYYIRGDRSPLNTKLPKIRSLIGQCFHHVDIYRLGNASNYRWTYLREMLLEL